METKGIRIENWLHSLLVYNLCDIEEFDEVYEQMRSRDRQGHEITSDLWGYVLNAGSDVRHYGLVSYVWKRKVALGDLIPSDETAQRIIDMAVAAGDVEFVNEIFAFYSAKDLDFPVDDVSVLVEAHINSDNLANAFFDLCIMHRTGIAVGEKAMRRILEYMLRTGAQPRDAWTILQKIAEKKFTIPLPLAKVVLELCHCYALDDRDVVLEAIAFYNDLSMLCPEGVRDVAVYNILIDTSRRAGNYQAAMFVIKEMSALGVVRNSETFEYIILACLEAGNSESAYRYFGDMRQQHGLSLDGHAKTRIGQVLADMSDGYSGRLHLELHSKA